jgi:heptosyltransferase II
MKILIELPSWLGDTIMTTPALENIIKFFGKVEITLVGSFISIEALKSHPNVIKTYVLDKKIINMYKTLKDLEDFDIFFSFRGSFRAKLMKFFISSPLKYQYNKKIFNYGHQVEKYSNFINKSLEIDSLPGKLILHPGNEIRKRKNKLLGINPGASYGNAKKWDPKKFANVAANLSKDYDIVILGGTSEIEIACEIEKYLIDRGVSNYQNLANKTSITELISQIKIFDLFITGDSGSMHLSAALNIPTVSIFGPTNHLETSQWMNDKSIIIKKNLDCQPCMKRSCPLNHNNCMKLIGASEVLEAVESLN